ncbi:hypothetical protein B0H13DRAFT_1916162 [Mycena leptocephala]|nr:hypothetical protein B0H13DRAFT_1916162 [Mycena leptocephala]
MHSPELRRSDYKQSSNNQWQPNNTLRWIINIVCAGVKGNKEEVRRSQQRQNDGFTDESKDRRQIFTESIEKVLDERKKGAMFGLFWNNQSLSCGHSEHGLFDPLNAIESNPAFPELC